MSDPVSQPDIDDVLASIRRLVSEDGRAESRRRQPAGSGRLVLTPALRVRDAPPEESPPEEDIAGDDFVSDAGAQDEVQGSDAPGDPSEHPEPGQARWDHLPPRVPGPDLSRQGQEDRLWPVDPPGAGQGTEPGDDAEDRLPEGTSTRAGDTATEDDGWVVVPARDDPVDEIIFAMSAKAAPTTAQSEPAHEMAARARPNAETTSDQGVGWPADPAADAGGVDEADAWQDRDSVAPEDGPGGSEATSAEALRTATLEQKIAELEAMLSGDAGGVTRKPGASDAAAEAAPASDTRPRENDLATDAPEALAIDGTAPAAARAEWTVVPPVAEVAEAITPVCTAEGSEQDAMSSPTAVTDAAPETVAPASEVVEDIWEIVTPAAEMPRSAGLAATSGDFYATDARVAPGTDEGDDAPAAESESLIDEDALRDLVAQMVREELQGALGERITRNVRKLVRREIHRALTAQDLD